jgi:hypothetical protein
MLGAANYSIITPVFHDEQSPLERVCELASAVDVGITQQSPGQLEFLIETIGVAEYGVRGSPHEDRLAAHFIANTTEQNHADPRFEAYQRALDDISATAKQTRAFSPKRIAAKIDQTRRKIATRIRSGEMITTDVAIDMNTCGLSPVNRGGIYRVSFEPRKGQEQQGNHPVGAQTSR